MVRDWLRLFGGQWSRRLVAQLLLLLLLSIPSFVGLLWGAANIPTEAVREHVEQAARDGAFADDYPRPLGFLRVDMFTECVGIGIAADQRPTLRDALAMRPVGACEGLRQFLQTSAGGEGSYGRYWHGYQVILRPLLALFSYPVVQVLICSITVALLAMMFWQAHKVLGLVPTLALVVAYVGGAIVPNAFLLVTHAPQLWVAAGGAIYLLHMQRSNFLLAFASLGALDAFTTFLNMPSLSLGLPLLVLAFMRHRQGGNTAGICTETLACAVAWSLGLVIVWVAKWLLMRVFFPGMDIMRGTTGAYLPQSVGGVLAAYGVNIQKTTYKIWLPLLALLGLWGYRRGWGLPSGWRAMLLPCMVPFIWMALLPGHARQHAVFVSQILWPSLAVFFWVVIEGLRAKP